MSTEPRADDGFPIAAKCNSDDFVIESPKEFEGNGGTEAFYTVS